ncbi:mannosyl-3-phosphoglycerate phosphatase [bacterium (candidate division B38) B3_B38]|nr:MAG: mannosyl-3-phosphoglycerate phosphatase [bacterium (candidate division B38) B3_B38]
MKKRLIVFTDLDGTFLDSDTYSFSALEAILARLEKLDVPLIFCSSKTRAEIEALRQKCSNSHPFISENGGGVFIPKGYFPFPIQEGIRQDRYVVIKLGARYAELVEALRQASATAGAPIRGFNDMNIEEVARECNLSEIEAQLAKQREFDEPFYLLTQEAEAERRICEAIEESGYYCTRGTRFFHILGKSDKGKAVQLLMSFFCKVKSSLVSISLGDSQNDLPMLKETNYAVLVQKSNGEYDHEVLKEIPNITLAPAPGPQGWAYALSHFLEKLAFG